MNNDRINILIACDKNYAPYYGVMLTSLFYNNKDSVFHIHWITDKFVPQEEKDKFLHNKRNQEGNIKNKIFQGISRR